MRNFAARKKKLNLIILRARASTNMKQLWNNYKSTIILLLGVSLGGVIGGLIPASAAYLKPIGDIFMNILFVLIVPMVLFSVASSICNLSEQRLLGKTLLSVIGVMLVMLLLGGLLTFAGMRIYSPVSEELLGSVSSVRQEQQSVSQLFVDAVSVPDFGMLFSTSHILPLMVIALLLGYAASKLSNKGVSHFLEQGAAVVMQMMDGLMFFAPIGLGCYFAGVMADGSGAMLAGYGRFMLLYVVLSLIVYLLILPLMSLFSVGGKGMKQYIKAILPPSLMAISTLSSSATMPVNIRSSQHLGVQPAMAESIVPLGTQLFKMGSFIGCVMKTAFVMLLMGQNLFTIESFVVLMGISILSSVVVGAVPVGAGSGELLICSILGADPSVVGVLIVLSTIIDMPATLLNATGNTILPAAIERLTYKRPQAETTA